MKGIGQGRVTNNLAPEVNNLNGALQIKDEDSIAMVYRMLDEEGLYIGASSALNVEAARQLALKLGPGMQSPRNPMFMSLTSFSLQAKRSLPSSATVLTGTKPASSPENGWKARTLLERFQNAFKSTSFSHNPPSVAQKDIGDLGL